LHKAAFVGRKEIAELLIAKGGDVNAKDVDGETPLDLAEGVGGAALGNKKEITALLRKHGGKTGEELKGGEPVAEAAKPEPPTAKAPDITLHLAAAAGHIEAVKQHLAAGTDVDAKNQQASSLFFGRTPLQEASGHGHKEVVELLIAEGADVNAKDDGGWTPLHRAVYGRQEEVVIELLIAKGVDVNAKDKYGQTPLDVAINYGRGEITDLLRKHGGKTGEELKGGEPVAEAAKPEPPTAEAPDISIHEAALKGNIEAVKQHLAGGADVNAKNVDGWTPLHEAAFGGRKEIVELLISNGADVNAKGESGRTPLDLATQSKRNLKTADLLRKYGGKTGKELEAAGNLSQPTPPFES
jgi:cytohesin